MAYRRAGGRRRLNAERRQARDNRRKQIEALILADARPCVASYGRGFGPRLAEMFGVHRSTIARDLTVVRQAIVLPDPCCDVHARFEAEWQERQRLEEAILRRRLRWLAPGAVVERVLPDDDRILDTEPSTGAGIS